MNILAIIPARGGSQRLPGKNTKLLNGKSLITRAYEQAHQSKYINRTIVVTDILINGVMTLYEPPELAAASTSMIEVVKYTLNCLGPYKPDIIVLLQPTSPLRTVEDIDNTIELVLKGADGADSRCNGKQNGAVYVFKPDYILPQFEIYQMPLEKSVDINTLDDFELAEKLLKEGK